MTSPDFLLMLIEALSASSSINSIGSSIFSPPADALCSLNHSMRLRSVSVFFLMTKTAGSARFCRGTPMPVADTLSKSRIVCVNVAGRRR